MRTQPRHLPLILKLNIFPVFFLNSFRLIPHPCLVKWLSKFRFPFAVTTLTMINQSVHTIQSNSDFDTDFNFLGSQVGVRVGCGSVAQSHQYYILSLKTWVVKNYLTINQCKSICISYVKFMSLILLWGTSAGSGYEGWRTGLPSTAVHLSWQILPRRQNCQHSNASVT